MKLKTEKYCTKCQYVRYAKGFPFDQVKDYDCKLANHVFGRKYNKTQTFELGWYHVDGFDNTMRMEVPDNCPFILEMTLEQESEACPQNMHQV